MMFRLPGLAAFLAAAKQMTHVMIECTSTLEAAQADFLLGQCTAINVLSLSGRYMPAVLPSSVMQLNASFSDPSKCECSTSQPDALIHHAALLPQLRKLILRFCSSGQPLAVSLRSLVQLPSLQFLHISTIRVSAPYHALKWVQQQSCSSVSLFVEADTPEIAKHAAIVEQLSQMSPSCLSLKWEVPFTLELQALWRRLEITHFGLAMMTATST